MTLRVCSQPGCGLLTDRGLCAEHRRERDRQRGSASRRGYDRRHQAERRRWAPKVATGTVACARCSAPIQPDEPWDLGHTDDRTRWTGPEHARCNRATRRPGVPTPTPGGPVDRW